MSQWGERNIPAGAAIVIDAHGYIVGWNEGAEAALGYPATEVIGRACHHVLCGRDPEGGFVCHPWCALSRGAQVEPSADELVLYPRSAARDVLRVTLSVFRVRVADASRGWVVHVITSVEPVVATTRVPRCVEPAWSARTHAPLRPIDTRRGARRRKPPESDRH